MSVSKPLTSPFSLFFFFLNNSAPTEISPLPLPPVLPTSARLRERLERRRGVPRGEERLRPSRRRVPRRGGRQVREQADRKSTRLNSSHSQISYAVFCLKKKKKKTRAEPPHGNISTKTTRS